MFDCPGGATGMGLITYSCRFKKIDTFVCLLFAVGSGRNIIFNACPLFLGLFRVAFIYLSQSP